MATVRDCLQELVDLGTGFYVHSDASGAYRPSRWESAALLADMHAESPGVLRDPAWIEWSALPNGSKTCSINYGTRGTSNSHREVPGYGHLRAFEASQKQSERVSASYESLDRLLRD